MNGKAIPLGRILGIRIGLDVSWFFIFMLMTWSLAVGYFPEKYPDWPAAEYWGLGAAATILLFVSVLLHELGHSLVARRFGVPVHSITLFIFGGVAQLSGEARRPAADFAIAIAGPIVSFLLAIFLAAVAVAIPAPTAAGALVRYLAMINVVLGVFNLVPGFPLDGGRVLRAILWGATGNTTRATVIAGNVGRAMGFLFVLFGVWLMFSGYLVNGMWMALIGWFLERAAATQIQQQQLHTALAGRKVSQVMSRTIAQIPPEATLEDLVENHVLGGLGRRVFVVTEDSRAVGLLTLHRIREVRRADWPVTTAAAVMIPRGEMKVVGPEQDLLVALEQMDRSGVNQLPVVRDGELTGMLSREDVISFVRTLLEIDPSGEAAWQRTPPPA